MTPTLRSLAATLNQRRQDGELLDSHLRIILLAALTERLLDLSDAAFKDTKQLEHLQKIGAIVDKGGEPSWARVKWDSAAKELVFDADAVPLTHRKVVEALRLVLKILTVTNLAAFHPSRPWGKTANSKTLTVVLQIGIGMPGSLELLESFNGLSNCSVFQLVDASLRADAARRSPLADQIQRDVRR